LAKTNSGTIDGDVFRITGLENTYYNLLMVFKPIYKIQFSVFSNGTEFAR